MNELSFSQIIVQLVAVCCLAWIFDALLGIGMIPATIVAAVLYACDKAWEIAKEKAATASDLAEIERKESERIAGLLRQASEVNDDLKRRLSDLNNAHSDELAAREQTLGELQREAARLRERSESLEIGASAKANAQTFEELMALVSDSHMKPENKNPMWVFGVVRTAIDASVRNAANAKRAQAEA